MDNRVKFIVMTNQAEAGRLIDELNRQGFNAEERGILHPGVMELSCAQGTSKDDIRRIAEIFELEIEFLDRKQFQTKTNVQKARALANAINLQTPTARARFESQDMFAPCILSCDSDIPEADILSAASALGLTVEFPQADA